MPRSANIWIDNFEREEFLDLVFICDGHIQVKANKIILASVSGYIKNIIQQSQDDIIYISVPDIDPLKLKVMMGLLYEGNVKANFDEIVALKEIFSLLAIHIPNAKVKMANKNIDNEDSEIDLQHMLNALPTTSLTNGLESVYVADSGSTMNYYSETSDVKVKVEKPDPYIADSLTAALSSNNESWQNGNHLSHQSQERAPVTADVASTYVSMSDTSVPCLQLMTVENSVIDEPFPSQRNQSENGPLPSTLSKTNQNGCVNENDTFSNNANVFSYEERNGMQGVFPCIHCKITFSSPYYLLEHYKTCREKVTGCDMPFTCIFCNKRFSRQSRLRRHVRLHEGYRPHKCELCETKFRTLAALKKHVLAHTDERTHECETCGKKFRQTQHLRSHERIHSGDKPFICSVCNTRFMRRESLKSHFLIHTGEKPYTCNYCGNKFRRSGQLAKHKKSHLVPVPLII